MTRSALVLAGCLLASGFVAAQPAADSLRADLAAFRPRLDAKVPKGAKDPKFWAVVHHGKAAVPDLLKMLDDETTFDEEVPKIGGRFAVGDAALEAFLEIVDVPWQELVPRSVKSRVHDKGFGAYYEYVRASPRNRKQLAQAVRGWYAAHESKLVFTPIEGHPAGGYWGLPEQASIG